MPPCCIIKNELPLIFKSYRFPVDWEPPSFVMFVEIEDTLTPRPICFAFCPPVDVSALGPDAACVV